MLCQTFTASEECAGAQRVVDLIPGGADVEVTDANRLAFVTARFKFAMMDRIATPLAALLRGFYEVVPEATLTGKKNEVPTCHVCVSRNS